MGMGSSSNDDFCDGNWMACSIQKWSCGTVKTVSSGTVSTNHAGDMVVMDYFSADTNACFMARANSAPCCPTGPAGSRDNATVDNNSNDLGRSTSHFSKINAEPGTGDLLRISATTPKYTRQNKVDIMASCVLGTIPGRIW